MSRALLILANDQVRARAVDWIRRAPEGTRVEFKGPQRTLDQNARMWAMLSDIAAQKKHFGRSYDTDQWKCLFLHALGQETQFIPALDGNGFIPYGQRSSDLSKEEMSAMIDLMTSWGTEHGVVFHEPQGRVERALEHKPTVPFDAGAKPAETVSTRPDRRACECSERAPAASAGTTN